MNFAHIVFLDFDGPLFPEKMLLVRENNEDNSMLSELNLHPMVTYWKMEPSIIAMLNQLYDLRPYFIVVSSSWGTLHTKEQIETLLATNGVTIPLHEDWKLNLENKTKAQSINEWLSSHKIADYMIVDDHESGEEFTESKILDKFNIHKNKIILLSPEDGVLMVDFFKMKSIVANWN